MKLWINTLVWGQNYIHNFVDYVIPSLLAPGNMPSLLKHVDAEYDIYTRKENAQQLLNSSAIQKLGSVIPTFVSEIEEIDFRYHGPALQGAFKPSVISRIHENKGATIFCSPDELWADGSFDYIGRSLAAGNVAIMTPGYRITSETVFDDIFIDRRSLTASVEPLTLQKLLLKHMHPHVGASHYAGPRCPQHPEYIAWPVANEGVIFYHIIHSHDSPSVYVPHLLKTSSKGTLSKDNGEFKFEIAPANRVLCASLTSINWMTNWLHDGKPHDPLIHAKYIYWYHESDWDLMHPIRIQATDEITEALWEQEEQAAQRYFDVVKQRRDALITGKIPAGFPPNSPSSCGVKLWPGDIDVSKEVLQWVLPVIDGRFPQATLDYLDNLSAGDGW